MQSYVVDGLQFDFPDDWLISKYDEWAFYRNQFIRLPLHEGPKAIDLVAIDPQKTLWLIEAKDYRQNRRQKSVDIVTEVSGKAVDTLACMLPASLNANVQSEQEAALAAVKCRRLRLVFHLETAPVGSPVFDRRLDQANLSQKLRQLAKSIDPHAAVVSRRNLGTLPWSVS